MEQRDARDPRLKGAETKRARTRGALLSAGYKLFSERGWYDTRMEDIAKEARVGTNTVYVHFSNKQALLGHACARYGSYPSFLPKWAHQVVATDGFDPIKGIADGAVAVSRAVRKDYKLIMGVVAAMQEQAIKVGPPVDDDDVRRLVPLTEPLTILIRGGQEKGIFLVKYQAEELGEHYTNALLNRMLHRSNESADDSAKFLFGQMLPALIAK